MSDTTAVEEAISFSCEQTRLWGILSRPPADVRQASIAVLIVVGGPQYRVGSHRQFVLLARALARSGFPTLRFDYSGMGDSEGAMRDFKAIAPDIRAALDALCKACPGPNRVVVWGLCDAASATLMFATSDPRVVGIVAANPWARSESSLAAARVRHYYASRIVRREFWIKLLRGGLNLGASLRSLASNLKGALSHRREASEHDRGPFQAAMARGLVEFPGRVLLILSGNDLTAKEFLQYADSSVAWRSMLEDPRLTRLDLPEADHTFSRRTWGSAVEAQTIAWLNELR